MTMGDRIAVITEGRLKQVDTPQELHERPTNLFVAGFIGSPAMNFFPARVVAADGGAAADAGFFRAPLSGPAREAVGREVIVGVRPEHIEDLAHAPTDGHLPVDARVEVVEYLGSELQLHLSSDGGKSFVARVSTESQARPGAPLRVGFDLRRLHVFDKETQQAIR
jgi:multiple sugar transport system ATP-binding protein